jgi:hypothetical protein
MWTGLLSKTLSSHLTLQAGRSWTPYTYEFYDNPGNYLGGNAAGIMRP